ncbi:GntR family transcriptional regulator [Anaerococcus lactolyticus]|uniref:GntR family transcriptional regulator n=1 Tax=Anaerococcus lactolyticus S7-1-13 TaxID=1284686 RepID=A0A095X100_9FIRM|nr:GntR family transcriptional regulator [Anaerococcus lactolyticus]KGF03386.1 GntR family transcriptional regulator [Anaerococcus lactolyticus S7-1-13]
MFLEIDFKSDLPIYEQIRRGIIIGLANGQINPGDKLPSVREMAENIGINLHTVNKAYKLLEADGVLTMDRRYGSLISEEKNAMKDFDTDKISGELDYLLAICKLKGLKKEDFIDRINKKWENKND